MITHNPPARRRRYRATDGSSRSRNRRRQWWRREVRAVPPLGLLLGLALVGVYGVTSYGVSRRTREIGVRVALGADPSAVLRPVLAQGLRPVAAGLLIGVPVAITAAAASRRLLFGLGPLDPIAFGAMAAAVLLTAATACYLPARRAAGVDPVVALRAE